MRRKQTASAQCSMTNIHNLYIEQYLMSRIPEEDATKGIGSRWSKIYDTADCINLFRDCSSMAIECSTLQRRAIKQLLIEALYRPIGKNIVINGI